MAQVFTAQAANGNSTEQALGPSGKGLVIAEGTLDGTLVVQAEAPNGNFAPVYQGGQLQSFTTLFCIPIEGLPGANLRLALSGVTTSNVNAWIMPLD
jgi:hypothetical protein